MSLPPPLPRHSLPEATAYAFFHLLFQSQPPQQQYNQQYYQQYYQGAPGSRVQISPIPREVVALSGYTPGSIVISTSERRLYYVLPGGQAIRYGIGVGRPGFAWSGTTPSPRSGRGPIGPPRRNAAPAAGSSALHAGRRREPAWWRAMYLGSSLYRIHGSNEPGTIGQAVSSGCIRITNEDVVDLYSRVRVGTKVVVLR